MAKHKIQKKQTLSNTNKLPIPAKPKQALSLLIVFCIPVLLYLQTLSFGLVHFDDDNIIVNNRQFLSHVANMPQAFTTDAFIQKQSVFYRPLQTVSYMVDMLVSLPDKPVMFHLSNLLLFGFIACSLFVLLRQLHIPHNIAMLATIVYSVHPLFVPTVAWIPARGDIQLTLFSLVSLNCFITYVTNKKMLYAVFHFIAFILALFSKETAAVLPLLCALYIITMTNEKPFTKTTISFALLYAAVGIAWFLMRTHAIVTTNDVHDTVGLPALLLTIRTIPESLAKCFVPIGIVPFPGFTVLKTVIGTTIIGIISFLFYNSKTVTVKKKIFSLGWFVIFMIPTLFFKHTIIDYLDHRFLLPLIGILLFALFIVPKAWLEKDKKITSGIMITLTVILSTVTFIKSADYKSATTFYNAALQQSNVSPMVYHNRGCQFIDNAGNWGAIDEYTKAITVKPDYVDAFINRGTAYTEEKVYAKAISDYNRAIELSPLNAKAYYNRGCAYQDSNVYDKAITDFTKAITLRNDYFGAYINRGTTYESLNELDKTIDDYTTAIALKPNSDATYFFRGIIYYKQGNLDAAIADYTKAISLKPEYIDAYYNRGFIFDCQKNYIKAIADYSKAISLKPDFADVYVKRGLTYYNLALYDSTIADFTKAIAIDPNYADAYNNRGVIYLKKGLPNKACQDFTKASQLGSAKAQGNYAKYCK